MARKRRPNPLTIRLPDDERDTLKARARQAGLSVSGYFRVVAFDTPRRSRTPSVSEQALAKINTALGKIGGNANQLAHQANLGSWPDSRLIEQMRDDIRAMRLAIAEALGAPPPPGLTAAPAGP